MRAIYLIRYGMRGGSLHMVPFYAANLAEAVRKFHAFMASRGCEKNQYRITSNREIAESAVIISNHREYVDQLTPEDQLAFYQDREARQTEAQEIISPKTAQNLNRLKMEFA